MRCFYSSFAPATRSIVSSKSSRLLELMASCISVPLREGDERMRAVFQVYCVFTNLKCLSHRWKMTSLVVITRSPGW